MDVSVIDELPPGRQPIDTRLVDETARGSAVQAVRQVLAEGRQAYWVCTLIEPSDALRARAAVEAQEELAAALPDARVGLLHGRMEAPQKAAVMQAFKQGEIDLLVATTVVEVGVDVPNASLMVIEDADRLGLAQLHQLRGRVGRGAAASRCLLLYSQPLSQIAQSRLAVIRDSQDGFWIAEQDLKLRGPGELLGARQTGEAQFRIADLGRDGHLIGTVVERGERLLREDPGAAQALLRAWAPADRGHIGV
jgi:ATP-dependent DNA helicase RecG